MIHTSPRFVISLATALVLHAIILFGVRTQAVVPALVPAKLSLRFAMTPAKSAAVLIPVTPSVAEPRTGAEQGEHPEPVEPSVAVLPDQPAHRLIEAAPALSAAEPLVAKSVAEPASQPLASAAIPKDAAAGGETAGVRVRYEQALAAWLDRHKYYPATLRRRRLEGEGILRVELDREGNVVALESFAALPDVLLERVAMDWVRRADPFPAVPQEIDDAVYSVRFPVRFHLD